MKTLKLLAIFLLLTGLTASAELQRAVSKESLRG
jgi:hypothetical protein